MTAETIEIPLVNGGFALIDATDYALVKVWTGRKICRWRGVQKKQTSYAMRRNVWMHRLIMNAPDGVPVDHINGNGLDNRRSNLRLCNHAQNRQNSRKKRNSTSQYKGVSRHLQSGKWQAQISTVKNGKPWNRSLGNFTSEIEAAKAYDAAAIAQFGAFAKPNFPLQQAA